MKLLLKQKGFTEEYLAQIRTQIPSKYHIVEAIHLDSIKKVSPDILLVLYGTKRTEHYGEVMVQWTHQTSCAFRIKLSSLEEWLTQSLSSYSPCPLPLQSLPSEYASHP